MIGEVLRMNVALAAQKKRLFFFCTRRRGRGDRDCQYIIPGKARRRRQIVWEPIPEGYMIRGMVLSLPYSGNKTASDIVLAV